MLFTLFCGQNNQISITVSAALGSSFFLNDFSFLLALQFILFSESKWLMHLFVQSNSHLPTVWTCLFEQRGGGVVLLGEAGTIQKRARGQSASLREMGERPSPWGFLLLPHTDATLCASLSQWNFPAVGERMYQSISSLLKCKQSKCQWPKTTMVDYFPCWLAGRFFSLGGVGWSHQYACIHLITILSWEVQERSLHRSGALMLALGWDTSLSHCMWPLSPSVYPGL